MTTNERSMDCIYREYCEKVLRYARSKLPSPQDAEDVCSAVFLKVQRGLSSFDERKASLSTWIYSITRNSVIDFYRRSYVFAQVDEELACAEDMFEGILNAETLEELACALESLSDRERNIILLHYYSGFSLKAIAERLGISYSHLKALHGKALLRLKQDLRF